MLLLVCFLRILLWSITYLGNGNAEWQLKLLKSLLRVNRVGMFLLVEQVDYLEKDKKNASKWETEVARCTFKLKIIVTGKVFAYHFIYAFIYVSVKFTDT